MASEYEGLLDLLEQKRAELGELEKQIAAETPPEIKAAHARSTRNILAVFSCAFAVTASVPATVYVVLGPPPQHADSVGLLFGASAVYAGLAVIFAHYAKSFHNRAQSYNARA